MTRWEVPDAREGPEQVDLLLTEQLEYYRAVADEYEKQAIPGAWGGELTAAVDSFRPSGSVLELACGTGAWTEQLLRYADVTAIDASPEMLAIAAARLRGARVRFIRADIFTWTPQQQYDVVFFGFWLSHVPPERFASFWALGANCLKPTGRVLFVDDAHRTPDELVYGPASPIVRRRLSNGNGYRVVKVPHRSAALEESLTQLGWRITVTPTSGPFFYGVATLG